MRKKGRPWESSLGPICSSACGFWSCPSPATQGSKRYVDSASNDPILHSPLFGLGSVFSIFTSAHCWLWITSRIPRHENLCPIGAFNVFYNKNLHSLDCHCLWFCQWKGSCLVWVNHVHCERMVLRKDTLTDDVVSNTQPRVQDCQGWPSASVCLESCCLSMHSFPCLWYVLDSIGSFHFLTGALLFLPTASDRSRFSGDSVGTSCTCSFTDCLFLILSIHNWKETMTLLQGLDSIENSRPRKHPVGEETTWKYLLSCFILPHWLTESVLSWHWCIQYYYCWLLALNYISFQQRMPVKK